MCCTHFKHLNIEIFYSMKQYTFRLDYDIQQDIYKTTKLNEVKLLKLTSVKLLVKQF